MSTRTVIVDYGMGNLRSVQKACEHLGYAAHIQTDLAGADKVIVPGVGAFGAAMENLAQLADDLREWAAAGKPLLGICLGQQLLFESSEERGSFGGLAILKGVVKYLPKDTGLKVPHIGWSELTIEQEDGLLQGVDQGSRVYFVHSLYTECEEGVAAATTVYGVRFASAVQRDNVWGTQFHPEKSGGIGLSILRNFLAC